MVFPSKVGLPKCSVFHPFLFACSLDNLLIISDQFVSRSIRPTDFLATQLRAFEADLALAITDVSFQDIASVAQLFVNEIERRADANYQKPPPGKSGAILFPCVSKDIKYIWNQTDKIH